ncbi:hypothetical protein EOK75_20505 (plasmid) [Pseudorhodobacter turbinis]|uniref:Uncharacterized protein n=1 Tax=Pseudorhodobacter turbinis TaxID=2500533 RepID=A0A4P8ELH2_9RHOB|nr:hypothetical protein [Pseudorhodobacter turbinis]QCO58140.1 hypothetical protein EOK75_20505 [Pseudorhodobacter turbinis]
MLLVGFFMTFYIVIALIAATMTYCEQRRTQGHSTLYTLLGFIACAFWPLTLASLAVSAKLHET